MDVVMLPDETFAVDVAMAEVLEDVDTRAGLVATAMLETGHTVWIVLV